MRRICTRCRGSHPDKEFLQPYGTFFNTCARCRMQSRSYTRRNRQNVTTDNSHNVLKNPRLPPQKIDVVKHQVTQQITGAEKVKQSPVGVQSVPVTNGMAYRPPQSLSKPHMGMGNDYQPSQVHLMPAPEPMVLDKNKDSTVVLAQKSDSFDKMMESRPIQSVPGPPLPETAEVCKAKTQSLTSQKADLVTKVKALTRELEISRFNESSNHNSKRGTTSEDVRVTFENLVGLIESNSSEMLTRESVCMGYKSLYYWLMGCSEGPIAVPSEPGSDLKSVWPEGAIASSRTQGPMTDFEGSLALRKLSEKEIRCVARSVLLSETRDTAKEPTKTNLVHVSTEIDSPRRH